jgi:hypothetical protein
VLCYLHPIWMVPLCKEAEHSWTLNFGRLAQVRQFRRPECCLQAGATVHSSPPRGSHASFERGSENACTKSLNIARCECRGRPPSSEVACKQRQKTIVMPIRVTPPANAGWTAPPSALFVVEAGAQVHGNKIELPGYHKGGLDIDEQSADFAPAPAYRLA